MGAIYYPYFADKQTEPQRNEVTCPRPHSQQDIKRKLKSVLPGFSVCILNYIINFASFIEILKPIAPWF